MLPYLLLSVIILSCAFAAAAFIQFCHDIIKGRL